MAPAPSSAADVDAGLRSVGYLPGESTALVSFLATRLGKPVLVEGPAGVGKTELAKALSRYLDRPLVRLQCYEGLDERSEGTRLNSSHANISYAVFCLKKKTNHKNSTHDT